MRENILLHWTLITVNVHVRIFELDFEPFQNCVAYKDLPPLILHGVQSLSLTIIAHVQEGEPGDKTIYKK